jgi:hypothetical protein
MAPNERNHRHTTRPLSVPQVPGCGAGDFQCTGDFRQSSGLGSGLARSSQETMHKLKSERAIAAHPAAYISCTLNHLTNNFVCTSLCLELFLQEHM